MNKSLKSVLLSSSFVLIFSGVEGSNSDSEDSASYKSTHCTVAIENLGLSDDEADNSTSSDNSGASNTPASNTPPSAISSTSATTASIPVSTAPEHSNISEECSDSSEEEEEISTHPAILIKKLKVPDMSGYEILDSSDFGNQLSPNTLGMFDYDLSDGYFERKKSKKPVLKDAETNCRSIFVKKTNVFEGVDLLWDESTDLLIDRLSEAMFIVPRLKTGYLPVDDKSSSRLAHILHIVANGLKLLDEPSRLYSAEIVKRFIFVVIREMVEDKEDEDVKSVCKLAKIKKKDLAIQDDEQRSRNIDDLYQKLKDTMVKLEPLVNITLPKEDEKIKLIAKVLYTVANGFKEVREDDNALDNNEILKRFAFAAIRCALSEDLGKGFLEEKTEDRDEWKLLGRTVDLVHMELFAILASKATSLNTSPDCKNCFLDAIAYGKLQYILNPSE